jgi:DNA-binding NarL/FixJ family response regulator
MLRTCGQIEVVGATSDVDKIISMVMELSPDVVLTDMAMPLIDGSQLIRQIHKVNGEVRVLLVSEYENREHILRGLEAGGSGYITKKATALDLVSAILTVYNGGCFLYPSVAKTLVTEYLSLEQTPRNCDPYDRLTDREKEVLKLIAEGYKSKEIAARLRIALNTVQAQRTSLMRKLGMHNRVEIVEYAIRKHLIEVNC